MNCLGSRHGTVPGSLVQGNLPCRRRVLTLPVSHRKEGPDYSSINRQNGLGVSQFVLPVQHETKARQRGRLRTEIQNPNRFWPTFLGIYICRALAQGHVAYPNRGIPPQHPLQCSERRWKRDPWGGASLVPAPRRVTGFAELNGIVVAPRFSQGMMIQH